MSRIESGKRPPSPELLYAIALNFPVVDIGELLTGNPSCHTARPDPADIRISGDALLGHNKIDFDDYLAVPLVEGKIAAGHGAVAWNNVESLVWVYRPEIGNKSNLISVRVTGDSMNPTIPDGSIVIIDRDQWMPSGERKHIWAIRDAYGSAAIKRLYKADNSLIILSDNFEEYPPKPSWTSDLRRLVIGRVVWMWRSLG